MPPDEQAMPARLDYLRDDLAAQAMHTSRVDLQQGVGALLAQRQNGFNALPANQANFSVAGRPGFNIQAIIDAGVGAPVPGAPPGPPPPPVITAAQHAAAVRAKSDLTALMVRQTRSINTAQAQINSLLASIQPRIMTRGATRHNLANVPN